MNLLMIGSEVNDVGLGKVGVVKSIQNKKHTGVVISVEYDKITVDYLRHEIEQVLGV